ncbi:MAG: DUF692 domain-containing protein [Azospirillaceae bacterium]
MPLPTPSAPVAAGPIPATAGIGLRGDHLPAFVEGRPEAAWLEIHPENYLDDGGPRVRALDAIAGRYPLSCHGVGLSLGSADGIDDAHLERIARLVDRVRPGLVSEHVSWSVTGGAYLDDLLPLPYTEEALAVVARNVARVQDRLGRAILVENPSTYVAFAHSTMPEWDFMAEIVRRTGCGLLLDVNNIHVSAFNHAFDAAAYLKAVPLDAVAEIHVAGHALRRFEGDAELLIDTHGGPVAEPVWALLEAALARTGPVPVLVEWDTDLPPLDRLLEEARTAQALMDRVAPAGEAGRVA